MSKMSNLRTFAEQNVTGHQDAYIAGEIIRHGIINVNYLRAKTSNHAITRFLNAATVKIRISQIAQCAKHIRQPSLLAHKKIT